MEADGSSINKHHKVQCEVVILSDVVIAAVAMAKVAIN